MPPEQEEIARVVAALPRDMAREVLNFARFLLRRHDAGQDWGEDPLDLMDRWDAIDSPAAVRDVA